MLHIEAQEVVAPSRYLHAFLTDTDMCIQMVEMAVQKVVNAIFFPALLMKEVVEEVVIFGTIHITQYEEMCFATELLKEAPNEEKMAKYVLKSIAIAMELYHHLPTRVLATLTIMVSIVRIIAYVKKPARDMETALNGEVVFAIRDMLDIDVVTSAIQIPAAVVMAAVA